MSSRSLLLSTFVVAGLALFGCKPKGPPPEGDASLPGVPEVVPPAAPFNATPVAQFADAGNLEGQSPFQQGTYYEANGQLWMARLVLERQALSEDATKADTELLVKICQQQGDAACVAACGAKLGRKIMMEAGGSNASGDAGKPGATTGQEHKEPDTELAHARDLVLKLKFDDARKALEPKVLDGKASREEVRMLKTICEKQRDRMCVALCESKLR